MSRNLALCLISLLAVSCAGEPGLTLDPSRGAITGVVRGLDGAPLVGATVRVGAQVTQTDAQGRYLFEQVTEGSARVRVALAGYADGDVPVPVVGGAETDRSIVLAPVHEQVVSAAAVHDGVRITGDRGVGLTFGAGTWFLRPDGSAVTGDLTISTATLDDPSRTSAAPGGMLARLDDGVGPLESFGMVSVTVTDASGVEVQPNRFVGLEIPLSPTASFVDGDTPPLFHFDEELGVWVELDTGVVSGGYFHADVPHFSWWNCDDYLETTCITTTVVTPTGDPVPGGSIGGSGVDYMGDSYASLDGDGTFSMLVRTGSLVRLSGLSGSLRWSVIQETPVQTGSLGSCFPVPEIVAIDLMGDTDGDGVSVSEGDCDDGDPLTYPGAPETCDEPTIDRNCDGATGGPDLDGDGWGLCTDCDDARSWVRPDAPDLCDDEPDNNCDGEIDPREQDLDGDGLSWCDGECDDTVAGDGCPRVDLSRRTVTTTQEYSCAVTEDGWRCWGAVPAMLSDDWTGTPTLSAGHDGVCGLDLRNEARCWTWGVEQVAPMSSVEGPRRLSALDLFRHSACGASGSEVWCWRIFGEEVGVPAVRSMSNADPIVKLVVEIGNWCALLADGGVLCGWTELDQTVAATVSGAVDVAVNQYGVVWIDWEGAVWSKSLPGGSSVLVFDDALYSEVALGRDIGCAITMEGRVACWQPETGLAAPGPDPALQFIEIDVGDAHGCGRTVAGGVVCWGSDGGTGRTIAPEL